MNTTIYSNPLAQDWDNGTGTYSDSPATTDGVSWKWRTGFSGSQWTSSSFSTNITASFPLTNIGGGTWYYTSSNSTAASYDCGKCAFISIRTTLQVSKEDGLYLKPYLVD